MNKKQTNIFPKNIGQYRFYKSLNEDFSFYHFGYYKDAKGKLYVCKLWEGKKQTEKFKGINNEIFSYKLLNTTYEQNKKEFDKKFPYIRIPKMYFSFQTKTKVYFLIENIQGKQIEKHSTALGFNYYEKIFKYMELMSKHTDFSKINILRRDAFDYFILLHGYLFFAIIKRPKLTPTFLKLTPLIYRGILEMNKNKKMSLVLRDLPNEENIIVNKKGLNLIDFENLTATNEIIQISNLLFEKFEKKYTLKRFLSSKSMKDIQKDNTKLSILKAMLAYGVIVALVVPRKEKSYFETDDAVHSFFSFVLELKLVNSENVLSSLSAINMKSVAPIRIDYFSSKKGRGN